MTPDAAPVAGPYSPVVKFQLDPGTAGLTGYAAPGGGANPCLIKLTSDDRPIVFVRATGYSEAAARDGFRGGWCGFEAPGLAQALSVGEIVRLHCGVSGEILSDIAFDPALFGDGAQTSTTLTATDVITHARLGEIAPDVAHILPFAVAHLDRHGARPFLEATYLTLLRRWPDASAGFETSGGESDDEHVATYLNGIIDSDEYRIKWGRKTPGPFHPAFRYDRDHLI